MKAQRGRYSSTLSLTSALDMGRGRSKPRPVRFNPRKDRRYPFYKEFGWVSGCEKGTLQMAGYNMKIIPKFQKILNSLNKEAFG
jgi:hypothetical protein